ncbi:hypothetical protein, partial [Aeromicrobium alkaliterrae]|uniref:hypothetical protein n=1 Tax=Aeromicrobium alkaliterrae TaxID=302168 RepID=UPI0031E41930
MSVNILQTPTQPNIIRDPDSPYEVQYEFKIATGPDGKSGQVVTSGLIRDGVGAGRDGLLDQNVTWRVPEGTLTDGGIYYWIVRPYDGVNRNAHATWVKSFKVDMRLGLATPSPYDTAGPVSVNLANGNAALSFESPTVETLGGPIGMTFSYNSLEDPNAMMGLTGSYFD